MVSCTLMLVDRPLRRLAAFIFSSLLIANAAGADTICESKVTRRRVEHNRYIIGREARCYLPSDHQRERIDDLQAACNLLITAYGEEEGRVRCQDLIAGPEAE